jgi:hypothetical protein
MRSPGMVRSEGAPMTGHFFSLSLCAALLVLACGDSAGGDPGDAGGPSGQGGGSTSSGGAAGQAGGSGSGDGGHAGGQGGGGSGGSGDADAASGSTSGSSGASGQAGTGGMGTGGAAAGSGGAAGGGVDGGHGCPDTVPVGGTACPLEGLHCGYCVGRAPDGGCGFFLDVTCREGKWLVPR